MGHQQNGFFCPIELGKLWSTLGELGKFYGGRA